MHDLVTPPVLMTVAQPLSNQSYHHDCKSVHEIQVQMYFYSGVVGRAAAFFLFLFFFKQKPFNFVL